LGQHCRRIDISRRLLANYCRPSTGAEDEPGTITITGPSRRNRDTRSRHISLRSLSDLFRLVAWPAQHTPRTAARVAAFIENQRAVDDDILHADGAFGRL